MFYICLLVVSAKNKGFVDHRGLFPQVFHDSWFLFFSGGKAILCVDVRHTRAGMPVSQGCPSVKVQHRISGRWNLQDKDAVKMRDLPSLSTSRRMAPDTKLLSDAKCREYAVQNIVCRGLSGQAV